MKSSDPNLTDHELQNLACLEFSHTYCASIRIKADDKRTYHFATSHYIDGMIEGSAGREVNAPPQRLVLRFTTGEVMVRGSRLERIEDQLAEGHLRGLKSVESRYAGMLKCGPIISSITVQRKEDV